MSGNTTSTSCIGSRPSWALVGAGCSNQLQVAQGQGLVRGSHLIICRPSVSVGPPDQLQLCETRGCPIYTACYLGHNSLDQLCVIPIPNPYHSDCYSIQMSNAGTIMPDSPPHAHGMSAVDSYSMKTLLCKHHTHSGCGIYMIVAPSKGAVEWEM